MDLCLKFEFGISTMLFIFLGCVTDKAAEQTVREYEQRDFPGYMAALATELATEGKSAQVRQLAGLLLKNGLAAKTDAQQQINHQRWRVLDGTLRDAVKQPILAAMRSGEAIVCRTAAQAAAEIAAVEVPFNEWPTFLPSILENIQNQQSTDPIRIASLECLGYTCERVAQLNLAEINEQTTDSMFSNT